jgi:hypothetical protein
MLTVTRALISPVTFRGSSSSAFTSTTRASEKLAGLWLSTVFLTALIPIRPNIPAAPICSPPRALILTTRPLTGEWM